MGVTPHFRFVVRGLFDGSPEEWSTSCHFTRQSENFPDAGIDDVNEGNVTSAVDSFFGSNLFPADVVLGDWRMYAIGPNGKMQGNGPLLHTYDPGSVKGLGGAWKMPSQIATVVTLVADNRGPAKFGRMYLPHVNITLENDGRISDAAAAIFAAGTTTFLKAVSDSIDMPATESSKGCNVSSRPAGSATGTLQQVDHVEVGRVLDTIRNRRKSMEEDRHVGGQIDW